MTIKAGDRIPDGKLKVMGADGPANVAAEELLGKGRVVLFSVPGAFTPTCSAKHLPGFHRARQERCAPRASPSSSASRSTTSSSWAPGASRPAPATRS